MNEQQLWSQPNNPADVGQFLSVIRRERGLSQAQLAEALNVPRRYIYELESGKDVTYITRLFGLLRVLDVQWQLRTTKRGAANEKDLQW